MALHHFSGPLWFAARGGWEHEQAPTWFGRLVDRLGGALADVVESWCTINGPNTDVVTGYVTGI